MIANKTSVDLALWTVFWFAVGTVFMVCCGPRHNVPDPATVPCEVVCDCQFDVTFPGADCTFINPGQVPGEEDTP